jgi:hypothetical protein
MPKPIPGLLRIEIIETRRLFGRPSFRWRTVTIANGEIGVWSEHYRNRVDCERSIRAHRRYLGSSVVVSVDATGRRSLVDQWAE